MQIHEVKTKADWRLFHKLPHKIYNDDPNWIAPLEPDVQSIFTPQSNPAFRDGEAKLWVVTDDAGKSIGRIAAFIDHGRNKKKKIATGGIGFFEMMDNQECVDLLFDTAEQYLKEKNVQAINAPINFGERDKYWGLLVEGYSKPLFQENYHPPYYRKYLEQRGYLPYEQLFTLRGEISDIPIDRIGRIGKISRKRYNIEMRFYDPSNWQKYAQDFANIYNSAFTSMPYFKAIEVKQVENVLKQFKQFIDPTLICYAYVDNKPVAFAALLPEINPFMKANNGKFGWWQKMMFFLRFKFMKKRLIKGLAFGIVPEYQKKGVFSVLVDFLYEKHGNGPYEEILLATIRGHNKVMIKTALGLGVKIDREHIAFRKMIDPDVPFKALPFYEGPRTYEETQKAKSGE